MESGPVTSPSTATRQLAKFSARCRTYSGVLGFAVPFFRSNGTAKPNTPEYVRHLAENFANWRVAVDGLVTGPLSIPIQTLRSLPRRTQITRHDCVEGWSAIGKWHGVQLSRILEAAGLSSRAK